MKKRTVLVRQTIGYCGMTFCGGQVTWIIYSDTPSQWLQWMKKVCEDEK